MSEFAVQTLSASEVTITGSEELLKWRERHKLKVPGHEYTPLFRRKKWDGTWMPGKWCRQNGDQFEFRISRGLLPRVLKDLGLQAPGIGLPPVVEVEAFCAANPKVAQLRDYQRRAFEQVLTHGWGRIAFATNAGKGAVIALLAGFAAQRKDPVLILCDEIAVFDALRGELAEWGGVEPALVKAGCKELPQGLVTLAMIPSLARRLSADDSKEWAEWVSRHKMLLLDEADKAEAATWRAILAKAKHTTWRAGFSGSFDSDLYHDLKMDELMGPVLDRVSNQEMIERGISAKPCVEIHAFEDTSSLLPFPRGWWTLEGAEKRAWVYERGVIYNERRHRFIASLIRPDTPTAVVINRLDHGRTLVDHIPGAVFLDGSVSDDDRLTALEAFRVGTIKVLVVTKILDRGSNRLGAAADIIFASAEGSATQILQRLGRGLRRADGKEYLRLVDVVDRVDESLGDKKLASAAGFLHGAAKRRLQVYANEGFDVTLVPQS